MTKHSFLPRFKTFFIASALLICLAVVLAGCNDNKSAPPVEPPAPPPPREYSVADLAEMASPSIAYIECWESAYPDYYYLGSGFVISADGKLVTNYHVLEGTDTAIVEIGGRIYDEVSVLAYNEEWDLAILQVPATGLQPLRLGAGISETRLGEQVVAMGNPEGLKKTVSDGIISTQYRRLEGFSFDHIQITAPISKGSSGGPLLNMRGEVIGINTLTYLEGQNLNFAVPVDLLHRLLEDVGPPLTVAEVFSYGFSAVMPEFGHSTGELAVVLSWDGPVDLDLEIWTEDFEYLGSSHFLGHGPDVFRGEQGEEWFVFQDSRVDTGQGMIDFTSGRFIVAVYYYGPEPDDGTGATEAALEFFYPDGRREVAVIDELWYYPPYDEWIAILVDVDAADYKILNFYMDAQVAVTLEWDSEADLDLLIWSIERQELYHPSDFIFGYDFRSGYDGIETFTFAELVNHDGDFIDFTSGAYDIFIMMHDPWIEETRAVLTLLSDEFEIARYEHVFRTQPEGSYTWWPVSELEPEILDYYYYEGEDAMHFLDAE